MTRILVVDDDSVLRRTLRINLRARGHEVLLAGTGEEAVSLFVAEQPDLVILDLGLPDLDGVEVLRRVRVALRRGPTDADAPATLTSGGLVLDFGAHAATRDEVAIHLTPTEWRLLAELARHLGKVVSHEDLLKAVWGPSHGSEHHYLRVYANQILRKIEADATRPRHLVNEPGLGYRLSP